MPPNAPISLIDVGKLSKPANTLVKKISDAVGGVFAPWQMKRMARAEAEAALVKQASDIEITDLHRRAVHRWVEEEAQQQANIEDVTARALPQLTPAARPNAIENDWIVNFFDRSRIVSDDQMQELWSRVLAGEANVPGTYSRRTVNFLSDLDKNEAELFAKLCGFVWQVGDLVPLVFDVESEIYNRSGINFGTLSHLDSIGLINFDSLAGFQKIKLPRTFSAYYYGQPLRLDLPEKFDNELDLGHVLLTRIGKELAPISGSKRMEGFWDYVRERWKQHLRGPATEGTSKEESGDRTRPATGAEG